MDAMPKARHVTTSGDHMAPIFHADSVNKVVCQYIADVEGGFGQSMVG